MRFPILTLENTYNIWQPFRGNGHQARGHENLNVCKQLSLLSTLLT